MPIDPLFFVLRLTLFLEAPLLLLLLLLVRRFHKEDFLFNFGDGVIIAAAVPVAVAVVVGAAEDSFLDTMIYLQPIYERVDWIVVLLGVLAFCYILALGPVLKIKAAPTYSIC